MVGFIDSYYKIFTKAVALNRYNISRRRSIASMGHVLFSHQVSGVSRINRDITAKVRRIGLLLLIASHLHRESLCSLLGKSPSFQRKHSRDSTCVLKGDRIDYKNKKKERPNSRGRITSRRYFREKDSSKTCKTSKTSKKDIYIYIMGKING